MSSARRTLKAYEVPVKRFTEVASPELLRQLETHSKNVAKFNRQGDFESERKALMQAKRVVSQLEATLRELEDVGCSLEQEDQALFSQKIAPTKQRVLTAIEQFQKFSKSISRSHTSTEPIKENETCEVNQQQQQLLQEEIKLHERRAELQAFEVLQKDIVELNELFVEFSKQVEHQGETVNQIESNVEDALENVHEGVAQLGKAAALKTSLYPLTGALLGTCIGGPVGLIAGLKIGAMTALGGTMLGFAGGRFLKKSQAENASEPSMLRSHSVPAYMDSSKAGFPHSNTSIALSKNGNTSSQLHED